MGECTDPNYQQAAAELYRLNAERLSALTAIQGDYGKWLIARLSLIHSAALYAIAVGQFHRTSGAYLPFLTGLVLTLLSGSMTWTNFTLGSRLMENWIDPFMLSDDVRWPKLEGPLKFWVIRAKRNQDRPSRRA
jgi:hypothetical protein